MSSSQRKVIFHGALGKLIPEPIVVFAETVAEALKAVSRMCPELAPNPKQGKLRVQVKGCRSVESLFDTNNTLEEIHVFPQFNGGKRGGITQIVIGVLLIAASFLVAPYAPWLSGIMLKAGALMLLGGVLQLMQQPKRDSASTATRRSYTFSAGQNTVDIGTRISILYGRKKVAGHILGFNINAEPSST